jgi:hypothetical protein
MDSDILYSYIMTGEFELFWEQYTENGDEGYFSEEFKNLVNSMLHSDPETRREEFKKQKEDKLSWYNNDKVSSIEEVKKLFE